MGAITQSDLDSAHLGLRLHLKSDADLGKTLRFHKRVDAFASAVIVEAVRREMGWRVAVDMT